jgi:ABC-type nickel/cobalt efflux system permease component RcnA
MPEHAQRLLGLIGGLLIALTGVWLLLQRLSGGADHVHLFGGHHHHHHPHEPAARKEMPGGWWGLIVLGVSGGIVPCWDAIAMLAFAISAQRLPLALPLLLAFSVGLAGVLVLLGVVVVTAKGFVSSRWGEGRFVRALPILSAALVAGLGFWLCYDSIHTVPSP